MCKRNTQKATKNRYKRQNGFSMIELVIVSAISLFGAIIIFLMLGTIREKNIRTLESQEELLSAATAMKQMMQEIRENAVFITSPQWSGNRTDSQIDFHAQQSYNGQDYDVSYILNNGKVMRAYTPASGISEQTVIAENVDELVFETVSSGNRYIKAQLTVNMGGRKFVIQDSVGLRN